jgi:hypothetical protein
VSSDYTPHEIHVTRTYVQAKVLVAMAKARCEAALDDLSTAHSQATLAREQLAEACDMLEEAARNYAKQPRLQRLAA